MLKHTLKIFLWSFDMCLTILFKPYSFKAHLVAEAEIGKQNP